jgi:hypothetical protein
VESDVWVNSYKPWIEMKSRQQHKIGQKVLEKVCEGLGGKILALPKDHEYVSGALTEALRCTKMEKKRKREERTCVDDSGDVADGEDEDEDGDSDYESGSTSSDSDFEQQFEEEEEMSPTSSAGGGIKTGGGLSPGIKAALVKIERRGDRRSNRKV